MTVEGDPRKEALERVAREWLADLSPHGADVGEDAAMMATELIAALDASPAPDREKVAAMRGSEPPDPARYREWLADWEQIKANADRPAAMRSGAPPTSTDEALAEARGFTDEQKEWLAEQPEGTQASWEAFPEQSQGELRTGFVHGWVARAFLAGAPPEDDA